MAGADRSFQAGGQYTHTVVAAAASLSLDLVAPPSAGLAWVIDSIWVYALGTVTAFDVNVTTNAGLTIGRIGGQVGGATNGSLPLHVPILGPICCSKGDATKIAVTATGASNMQVTANVHLAPA